MSFPNSQLGPFEGENDAWAKHVANSFVSGITSEMIAAPGCDAAHAAMAHLNGFICCALLDAATRGSGEQIMPDILDMVRKRVGALVDGGVGVMFSENVGPTLTVLPGGKA